MYKIFLSYSWKDTIVADEIDKTFQAVGTTVIRDIRDMKFREKITDFMKRINDTDFVLLLISDDFLRSPNCMKEILKLIQDDNFIHRILPITVGHVGIYNSEGTVKYYQYWDEEIKNAKKNAKKYLKSNIINDLRHLENVRNNLDIFFDKIQEMKLESFVNLKKDNYRFVFDQIGIDDSSIITECVRLYQLSDKEEQDILLENLTGTYKDNMHVLLAGGNIFRFRNENKKATKYYKRILEIDPLNEKANSNYASLLMDFTGTDYGEMELHFNNALKVNPLNYTALNNYANFHLKVKKNIVLAEQFYRKSLESNPNYSDALINYAVFLSDFRPDYKEAESLYLKLIDTDPTNSVVYNNYGSLLQYRLNKPLEAEQFYLKAIELNRNYVDAHNNYGIYLKNIKNDYLNAEKHYQMALTLNQNNKQTLLNYAILLSLKDNENKNLGKAELYYLKAIEIDPDYAKAHLGYAEVLFLTDKNSELGKRHLEIALKLNPKLEKEVSNS